MKFLFDIFPVILFFAAFKGAEYFPDGALSLASSFMGDGVTATTAPVFIATVTAILATILQVGWLKYCLWHCLFMRGLLTIVLLLLQQK